eukprot:snap_masked-scaffold_66-processed-gene-0.6-mRNA-1 protein AED:0.83 eAED:0.83 QI:0/-1/0/1/-1/1/1/0/312
MLYEPTGWMPTKEIAEQYSSDLGLLEVDAIRGLRLKDGIYELKIRWKGFLHEDETWEPLVTIEEDLPDVVHEYLNDTTQIKEIKERAQKYLKRVMNTVVVSAMSIPGRWTEHELEVLRSCIRTYGVGVYGRIISEGHITNKSIQAIYQATQKLLAKQSIYEYTKLQLDVEKVAQDNRTKYGTQFHVEKTRVIKKPEALVRRLFNLFKYGLRSSGEVGTIPFYRRNITAKERRESLRFLGKVKRGEEEKERRLPPIADPEAEIADIKERVNVDKVQDAKTTLDRARCDDMLVDLRKNQYDELPDEIQPGNKEP